MKIILMSVLALGVLSSNTYAGCGQVGCSDVKVSRLYLKSDGDIAIGTSDDEKKIKNCKSSRYIYLSKKHPLFKEIYATLLSTKRADEKVFIRTVTSPKSCYLSYLVVL